MRAGSKLVLPLLTFDLVVRFGIARHSHEKLSLSWFRSSESQEKTTIARSLQGEERQHSLPREATWTNLKSK